MQPVLDLTIFVKHTGISVEFRREGFGTNAMYALVDVARGIGCQEALGLHRFIGSPIQENFSTSARVSFHANAFDATGAKQRGFDTDPGSREPTAGLLDIGAGLVQIKARGRPSS